MKKNQAIPHDFIPGEKIETRIGSANSLGVYIEQGWLPYGNPFTVREKRSGLDENGDRMKGYTENVNILIYRRKQ